MTKKKPVRKRKKNPAVPTVQHGDFGPNVSYASVGVIQFPLFTIIKDGQMTFELGCPIFLCNVPVYDTQTIKALLTKASAEALDHAKNGDMKFESLNIQDVPTAPQSNNSERFPA